MMSGIRTFIERWRLWLIGAGVLLVADMYNTGSQLSSASASKVEEDVASTVSSPADGDVVDETKPLPGATTNPHGRTVGSENLIAN